MVRGFISGVFWGLVFTVMSLWIVTQLSDVVRILVAPNQITENAPDGAGVVPQSGQETANAPQAQLDAVPQQGVATAALAPASVDPAPNPDLTTPQTPQVSAVQEGVGGTAPATNDSAVAVSEDTAPQAGSTAPQPQVPASDGTPQIGAAPAPTEEQVEQATAGSAAEAETPPAPVENAPQAAAQDSTAATVDFSEPQVVELTEDVQEALQDAETPEAAPEAQDLGDDVADAEPDALPETGPKTNVTVNRLPTIGGDAQVQDDDIVEQAQDETPEFDENAPALQRFARPFENPDNLPLMAIILLTDGAGEIAQEPRDLPVAISYALDASLEGAAALMNNVRASGQEVVAIAPLIDRAQPADVEVAFADYLARVPEAVAVMDLPDGRFQADRKVAAQVIANLASQGLGMITYQRSFNAGLQMAERDGLPAVMVFRDFDGAGQDRAAISRFLDQAAFRAGQQQGVVMIGRDRPETIAAILEWSLGTRGNTVKLAPISAVLQN